MGISYHPPRGTILICDFSGFKPPEMTKRRLVIVISPQISARPWLCTVVALSTTQPKKVMPYHYKFTIDPPLPSPYNSPFQWLKGDMIYSISFDRLNLPFKGKDSAGKRIYDCRIIDEELMKIVQACVLYGLGIHD